MDIFHTSILKTLRILPYCCVVFRSIDKLRMACAEAMCTTVDKRKLYPEALMAVKAEGDLNRCEINHTRHAVR